MIQDKPKTRFWKCILDLLAYYINLVHFEYKKEKECSFKLFYTIKVPMEHFIKQANKNI